MGKGRIFSDDELPDYCQSVVIEDQHGRIKQLILPKALDLDRPKRARTWFTASQLEVLESEYQKNPYITGQDRQNLAKQLTLSETQVKVWFQNRRTKSKKEKGQEFVTNDSPTSLFNNFTTPPIQGLSCPKDLFNKTDDCSNTPDLSHNRPWSAETIDRNNPHATSTALSTLLPFHHQYQQQQALSWLLLSNNFSNKLWMTQQDFAPKLAQEDALDSSSSIKEDKREQSVPFFGLQQLNKQSLVTHFSSEIDPTKVSYPPVAKDDQQDSDNEEEIVID